MFTLDNALMDINWDFPDSTTNGNIGSIHPYPAKFIQEIPHYLIKILGVPDGSWIFDPFCGSGATLTEAQLAGIPSIGVDVNPIACLISQVKTQPVHGDLVLHATLAIEQAQNKKEADVPTIPNLDHWFKPDIQDAISKLLSRLELIEEPTIKEALRLSLSSILVRVSNQESDTRYAAIEKDMNASRFYLLFLGAVERIANIKQNYQPKTWETEVICNDVLKITPNNIKHPIGLVITSPPYPNAYEYWLYHKYRMFWLGYDPIKVKQQEIGARAHYFKKNHPTEEDFRCQMEHVLKLMWSVLVKDGHACIVIGRSKIHGKIVDNASMIINLAKNIGFEEVANIPRTIAPSRKTFNLSHAKIQTENLIVFRK
jgi:site-specific DNA-methyltransferase (cytosine-N4-specific)